LACISYIVCCLALPRRRCAAGPAAGGRSPGPHPTACGTPTPLGRERPLHAVCEGPCKL
jgi:hypothetical protein